MTRLAVVALLILAACSRELSLPPVRQFSLSPGFVAVAPREQVALHADGGVAPVSFAFAPGGRLSGEDATIDPASGAYRAGRRGAAVDVVEATDASGQVTTARLAVGAPLGISPALVGTAPGGSVSFSATGGKPPYHFTIGAQGGSGSHVGEASGVYVAGLASGDAVEEVSVSDATGDPAASATAQVHVGRALSVFPSSDQAVAPAERLQFVGLGGQPPYAYSVSGGSGGSIDDAGIYLAGPSGSSRDLVKVTDSAGASATVGIAVGPALRLTLAGGLTRPGLTATLLASGGKPPYAFRHAPKGNRTRGRVSATGEYLPGTVVGAVDLVEVQDATGTVLALTLPPLGPWQAHPPAGATQCLAGDLDGDGREDALFTAGQALQVWRLSAGGQGSEAGFHLQGATTLVPWDFGLDGQTDLFQVAPPRLLLTDAAGTPQGQPLLPWTGAAHANLFFAYGNPIRLATDAPCTDAGGTGAVMARLDRATGTLVAQECAPIIHDAGLVTVQAMTAGLITGREAVAWQVEGEPAIRLASIDPSHTGLGWPSPLAWPAGWTFDPAAARDGLLVLPIPFGPFSEVVVLLADGAGRVLPWIIQDGAWVGPFDPDPTGPGLVGVRFTRTPDGVVTLVGWGSAGAVHAWDVDVTGALGPPRLAGQFSFPVSCVGLVDVNGDGFADLTGASATSAAADVLLGDGGTYGVRVHLPGFALRSIIDVDGDGLDDVIAVTAGPGLRVFFGGGHQLALGPETPVPSPPTAVVALRLGAGPGLLWQDGLGTYRTASVSPDGLIGAPSILEVAGPVDMPPLPAINDVYHGARAADLSLGAPGQAVWWRANDAMGNSVWNALVLDGPGHATFVRSASAGSWCAYGTVGPHGGVASAVAALCLEEPGNGTVDVVALRAPLDAAGAPGPFEIAGLTSLAGASSNVFWLGEHDGSAAFLADIDGLDHTTRPPHQPLAVVVPAVGAPVYSPLGLAEMTSSVRSGVYGDLTGDGIPDLALQTNLRTDVLELLPGLATGGFGPSTGTTPSGGFLTAALRLSPGRADPVVQLGDELLPFPGLP